MSAHAYAKHLTYFGRNSNSLAILHFYVCVCVLTIEFSWIFHYHIILWRLLIFSIQFHNFSSEWKILQNINVNYLLQQPIIRLIITIFRSVFSFAPLRNVTISCTAPSNWIAGDSGVGEVLTNDT